MIPSKTDFHVTQLLW